MREISKLIVIKQCTGVSTAKCIHLAGSVVASVDTLVNFLVSYTAGCVLTN
jgi:hypothetical protein